MPRMSIFLLVLAGITTGCGTSDDTSTSSMSARVPVTAAPTSSTETTVSTTSSSTSTTTTLPDLIDAPIELDAETCRLAQVGRTPEQPYATGFPVEFDNLKPAQHVSIIGIPVDWSDYPGDVKAFEQEEQDIRTFTNYFEEVSEGRLTFDLTFLERWYRLPEPTTHYSQRQVSDQNPKLAGDAIQQADPDVDFSLYDIVVFVLPSGSPIPSGEPQTVRNFASFQSFHNWPEGHPYRVYSDEGWVRNYMSGGIYFDDPSRQVWSYYIHETGHMFNLPDWSLIERNHLLGPKPEDPLTVPIGPMSSWSMMSNQDGPSRTFDAWARWLMGWLSEDQVLCYDLTQIQAHGEFDVELIGLDTYEPGNKAVFIKLGETAGLAVESRRPIGLDSNIMAYRPSGRDPQGLVVYTIDTTKGNQEGALSLVPPEGRSMTYLPGRPPAIDALFNEGDVGYTDSLQIELIFSGASDVVRISPINNP